ncbi:GntP family permease, partial [Xanthomonas citri pv. citri]|nr:GntP family permease [Xanthomonas citri pv. citri]
DAAVGTLVRESEAGEVLLPEPRNALLPFLPILAVFVVNLLATTVVFPAMDWGYLQEEKYGGATLASRSAVWAVLSALLAAVAIIVLLNVR